MKRNKRTDKLSRLELTTMTERVLARLGPEGEAIRRRLWQFYQEHSDPEGPWPYEQTLKN